MSDGVSSLVARCLARSPNFGRVLCSHAYEYVKGPHLAGPFTASRWRKRFDHCPVLPPWRDSYHDVCILQNSSPGSAARTLEHAAGGRGTRFRRLCTSRVPGVPAHVPQDRVRPGRPHGQHGAALSCLCLAGLYPRPHAFHTRARRIIIIIDAGIASIAVIRRGPQNHARRNRGDGRNNV